MIRGGVAVASPEVWLGEDGILRVDYGAFNVITLAVVQSAYAQQRKISQEKLPVMIRGGGVGSVDYAAQRFASGLEMCAVTAARGVLVSTTLEKHLCQMFLAYHQPPYPTKMFTTEVDAVSWLKTYVGVLTT